MGNLLREGLPPLPENMQGLSVSEKGYPVPWFVAWIDGKPDFRVIGPAKVQIAMRNKCCWICGQPLGADFAFVIGPMCAVNRISSEPPSHKACAKFSAKACPFLTLPKAKRRESNLPDEYHEPAGIGIKRNPGVALVWITRTFRVIREPNGVLFRIGPAKEALWFAQGREATRDEVLESIKTGLPLLQEMARKDGPAAELALARALFDAMKYVPEELAA